MRETFAATAIATLVRPNQRWPTLCDNSDEIRVAVPLVADDSAKVRILSVHATRGSTRQEAIAHTFLFLRAASRWSVATYDTLSVEVEPLPSVQPAWCSWSPEPGTAVIRNPASTGGLRSAPVTINVDESCPWCRLNTSTMFRLGRTVDLQLPRANTPVYASGRGRYFTQNSTGTGVLVYDSTGTFAALVGESRKRPGEFGSVNAVVVDAQDSTYVLDNTRRRITVLAPDLTYIREISLPWPIDSFWILRDGRLLTVRTPLREGDPVSIHRASGEIIRTFGSPPGNMGMPCSDCGNPLVAIAPSGYRIWLAWSARYRIEEWDLTGRQLGVIENLSRTFGAGGATRRVTGAEQTPDSIFNRIPGLKKLLVLADGSLWVGYTHLDPFRGPSSFVDVLDPVRARLVRTIAAFNLSDIVAEGVRAVHRIDEYGFPETRLEKVELNRRRDPDRQPGAR